MRKQTLGHPRSKISTPPQVTGLGHFFHWLSPRKIRYQQHRSEPVTCKKNALFFYFQCPPVFPKNPRLPGHLPLVPGSPNSLTDPVPDLSSQNSFPYILPSARVCTRAHPTLHPCSWLKPQYANDIFPSTLVITIPSHFMSKWSTKSQNEVFSPRPSHVHGIPSPAPLSLPSFIYPSTCRIASPIGRFSLFHALGSVVQIFWPNPGPPRSPPLTHGPPITSTDIHSCSVSPNFAHPNPNPNPNPSPYPLLMDPSNASPNDPCPLLPNPKSRYSEPWPLIRQYENRDHRQYNSPTRFSRHYKLP